MKKEVKTSTPIGPFSQGIIYKDLVFTSGQIGLNPETGEIPVGIKEQTLQVLHNLKAVLIEAGSSPEKVLKCTIFLKNMSDMPAVNELYANFFPAPFPARSGIEVARLPKDVLVEIEAIAHI